MSKRQFHILVDEDVWFQVRALHINISNEVNEFLKTRTQVKDRNKDLLIKELDNVRTNLKELSTKEIAIVQAINSIDNEVEKKRVKEAIAEVRALRAAGNPQWRNDE